MTLFREPNTYIRTIEIPVHPMYLPLRFSSLLQFNTQYPGKSPSCHLLSFTFHAVRVSSLRLYLQRRTSLLLRVLREVHHYYFRGFPRSPYLHTSRRYSCKLYLRFLSTQSLVPVSETVRYSWS